MYSGQEIVSQEECKIVLAEFYEGVNCYDEENKSLKMTLNDWATATYSNNTLVTENFTVTPLIVEEPIGKFVEADIPEGTTGLEVIMHTEEYEKIRIMPLMYLRLCNNYGMPPIPPVPPVNYNYGYVIEACITDTNTTFTIIGEISENTATVIKVVGYGGGTNVLEVSLLDELGQVISHEMVMTTETRDIPTWVLEDGKYIQKDISREVILITAALADKIKLNDFAYKLYDCTHGPLRESNILAVCNLSEPEYLTRITADTNIYRELKDDSFEIGDTQFKLDPHTLFVKVEAGVELGTYDFYFEGALRIEITKPIEFSFDIYECFDNPNEFHIDIIEYFVDYKPFILIATNYDITDNCVGEYCFFDKDDNPIVIKKNEPFESNCGHYYELNGVRQEIPTRGDPIPPDNRMVWSQEKCKMIVTCESIGLLPCNTCIDCTNQPDGESVRLKTVTPAAGKVCSDNGELDRRKYIYGCEAGYVQPLGSYPNIPIVLTGEPTAVVSVLDYIHIKGTIMYMVLEGLDYTYHVPVGNLNAGITRTNIEDEADNSIKSALFLPFLYLSIFKLPFEYVTSRGLSNDLWYNSNFDFSKLKGIRKASGYDFKIELSELKSLLPSEWQTGFNWHNCCNWITAKVTRNAPRTDIVINTGNLEKIDEITCELNSRINYYTSNIHLNYGVGVEIPLEASGSFQEAFDKYSLDINMLTSKKAEAFGYQTGVYKQSLESRYPHD